MSKAVNATAKHKPAQPKRTSIGHSCYSRPTGKHDRKKFKRYRGQGHP